MFLFCLVFAMFCARLFTCASWSPAGKGLTSWLSFVVFSVSLSLSHWYPGSGVVLDWIDSWSLQPYLLLYKSKKGSKDQESVQSSITPDPGYHMEKWQKSTIKHRKQEPRGQPFPSRCPQGSNEQTRKHDKHNAPQKKYRLGKVSKIFYWRA